MLATSLTIRFLVYGREIGKEETPQAQDATRKRDTCTLHYRTSFALTRDHRHKGRFMFSQLIQASMPAEIANNHSLVCPRLKSFRMLAGSHSCLRQHVSRASLWVNVGNSSRIELQTVTACCSCFAYNIQCVRNAIKTRRIIIFRVQYFERIRKQDCTVMHAVYLGVERDAQHEVAEPCRSKLYFARVARSEPANAWRERRGGGSGRAGAASANRRGGARPTRIMWLK
eukprot:6212336-Pleurochrysis_carterae.AAC.1